jgi:hypothetical protein
VHRCKTSPIVTFAFHSALGLAPATEPLSLSLAMAFERMLEKRSEYLIQGRHREAHGLGAGLLILWTVMNDYEATAETARGGL